jgi:hypothetical protein
LEGGIQRLLKLNDDQSRIEDRESRIRKFKTAFPDSIFAAGLNRGRPAVDPRSSILD